MQTSQREVTIKFEETIRQKQHMASINTLYDHNLAVCILPTITLFLRGKGVLCFYT